MANRYFLNIGANWGDTANWSDTSGGTGGFSVPTNADDVFFDANSGNCTVNVASVAKSVNFTGYTNTITMTSTLTVSGSVTLVAAMTIAGASGLTINATGTFTSNGKTWPNALTFSATNTLTLADDLSIGGLLTINNATSTNVIGSFNINVNGGILLNGTMAKSTGTPIVNLLGGTWSGGGAFAIDVNINGNITILSNVYFGNAASTPTLTYTSGTVTVTSSTLNIFANTGQAPTLNTGGMTWNNVSYGASNAGLTLLSNLNIGGAFTTTTLLLTINGTFSINCSGGLDANLAQGAGTTTLNLLGGTWSGGKTVRLNTNINGNITISGTVGYQTGTLTYTSGTVTTTGSTLNIAASTTLNTSGMSWNNVTFSATNTTTLTSNLNVNGLLTIGASTTINGTFTINANAGISVNAAFTKSVGTPKVNLTGGSWTGGGSVNINLNINGNITIGNVVMGAATLTYVSGNVTHTGTLTIDGSGSSTTTLNTNGINWNNISAVSGTFIILLQSDLNIYGLYTTNGGGNNTTISGSFNINCYGGITNNFGLLLGTGNPTLNLYGGTWSMGSGFVSGGIQINTNIRGNITISGQVIFQSRTLRYISGKVNCLVGSIFTLNTSTIIDCNKVNFRTVAIFSGATLTMNNFFSGSALIPTTVRAAANYTITFQDGFEKITKFTKISNCTVSNRGQLLCITDKSNKGGNVGVRYINQMPNSVPLNKPSTANPMAFGIEKISDPNFILN